MLTTHNVPYALLHIRYIFKQQIRRLPGFSQAGQFKEESAARISESSACSRDTERLARKTAADKLKIWHGAGVGFSGIFNEPLSLRVKQGVITAVGVFVDFAVSYAFKSSGTGQPFAETADAGEHIHELDQGHNSRAIQNLADNYTEEVALQINGILHDLQGGTTELEKLQQKLADSQQEFDRLLDLSLECDASFLDEKLKHASEEIDNLQKQINQLTASRQKATNPNLQLTASDFRITEYSDTLVARIIERIDVVSANEIKIEFIGGYTVAVPLQE